MSSFWLSEVCNIFGHKSWDKYKNDYNVESAKWEMAKKSW